MTTPTDLAKKAAGTYVEDTCCDLNPVLNWISEECRHGSLAKHVVSFCESQPEILDPKLVLAESMSDECIRCRIPFKAYDHESSSTFPSEVTFDIDPKTGKVSRS